jgi:hypothetical protein
MIVEKAYRRDLVACRAQRVKHIFTHYFRSAEGKAGYYLKDLHVSSSFFDRMVAACPPQFVKVSMRFARDAEDDVPYNV